MFERASDLSDNYWLNDSELNFLLARHVNLLRPTDSCLLETNLEFWQERGMSQEQFKSLVMRYPVALTQNKERIDSVLNFFTGHGYTQVRALTLRRKSMRRSSRFLSWFSSVLRPISRRSCTTSICTMGWLLRRSWTYSTVFLSSCVCKSTSCPSFSAISNDIDSRKKRWHE